MRKTIRSAPSNSTSLLPSSKHYIVTFRWLWKIYCLVAASMFLGRQVVFAFQGTHRLVQRSLSSCSSLRHLSKTNQQRSIPELGIPTGRHRHSIRLWSAAIELSEQQKNDLESQIKAKGDEIRALKETGADKSMVEPLVEQLLALKAQLDPSILESPKKKSKTVDNNNNNRNQQPSVDESESDFITARSVDYSKWYNDIIRVTGLAEPSPVRGCMVIKPWGMSLWDKVRSDLDDKIKEHGAENAYFPLLIPKSFLSKEAEHVDGFAKECAVVTHHRLTAGEGGLIADPEAELEDPLIIRPTSETMIWYMFRKWINSHRYGMVKMLFLSPWMFWSCVVVFCLIFDTINCIFKETCH
jgi:WHEP-TRS domain